MPKKKCGCQKKNKIQRAIEKSQKPKQKPKIDEKNIFLTKQSVKTKKKPRKNQKKRKKY
jgi:hypothetical protein